MGWYGQRCDGLYAGIESVIYTEKDLNNEVKEDEVAEGTEQMHVKVSGLWYMLTVLLRSLRTCSKMKRGNTQCHFQVASTMGH